MGSRLITTIRHRVGGKSIVRTGFEAVEYTRKSWVDDSYNQRYHVYKSASERVAIAAASAKEAIAASGIKHPFKVVRGQAAQIDPGIVVGKGRLVEID